MSALRTSLGCAVVLLALESPAQPVNYDGHQLVRVDVRSAAELETLLAFSGDVWTEQTGIGPLDVRIPPESSAALAQSGLSYVVLSRDIGPATRAHLAAPPARGTFDQYMDLDAMMAWLNNAGATDPNLCDLVDVGDTSQGRDIWALHITGAGEGPKPAVLYHGLQHCREWITAPVVLYLADFLLSQYDADPCITDLVDRAEFYLIPCMNPDGYVYTWTTDRLWRKNRRLNPDGSYGVDLNRNWGFQWAYDDIGSSGTPSSTTYRGTAPFSEPETAGISGFITAHPEIRAHMDYHSYGQLVLWPFGYTPVLPPEPDASTFALVGGYMRDLIASVYGVTYTAGPTYTTIYPVNGSSVDWCYGAADRLSVSIELRDTGSYGFLLPPEQILPTCTENLPAILYLSQWATSALNIVLPDGVPAIAAPDEPTTFDVRILAGQESYVPDSAQLFYRVDGAGPFTAVPLTPLGGDVFRAEIPAGAPCGHTINFYIAATGSGGTTVLAPCAAPENLYHVPVRILTASFDDDFESDLGWTVENSPDLTSGAWERGVPAGGGDRGDPPTDADGSGRCYVTGLPDGDFDIDGGYTLLISPAMDATHPDSVLSFSFWYSNVFGADPGNDLLYIDASGDDGATWIALDAIGPSGPEAGGGWYSRQFVLAEVGLWNADTVRVRFNAGDLNDPSVVEAGIDAVRIFVLSCPFAAGDLNCDGSINVFDIDPFVLALTDPVGYGQAQPDCDALLADITGDGVVNAFDIDPFVELLAR